MAKIESLRDALRTEDSSAIQSSTTDLPKCPDAPSVAVPPGKPGPRDAGCLAEIANALGSKKGFVATPPDQAAATTAAVVLVRDGRGDYVVHADVWLGVLKTHRGAGADALRLAVARQMAAGAAVVGKKIETDPDARAALKAIAAAIPGACPTYFLVGSGVEQAKVPPELTPDHAACVQKDLARREGPGASYGEGTFRALEGGLSIWRETERALRLGRDAAAPDVRAVLEKKLAVIEEATRKIETKKDPATTSNTATQFMGEVHADAGVLLWRPPKDAGADGAADAATPKP
jgi:hypothetical protein